MIFELHSEEYLKIVQAAEAAQKAEKEEHDPTKKISGAYYTFMISCFHSTYNIN